MAEFDDAFEDADESQTMQPAIIAFHPAVLSPTAPLMAAASQDAVKMAQPATLAADAADAVDSGAYDEDYSSDECDESLYDLEDMAGRAGSKLDSAWVT